MDGVALRAMGGQGKNVTSSLLVGPSVMQTLFRHSLYPRLSVAEPFQRGVLPSARHTK